ncbi:Spherulation-specific family 4 [Neurospora hispaniola]|uniref:Spherulation-specific family 4 n=1 Tax=Neurospora hispaniola TaxID=588809 RepID=A0AAJ0MR06_9PEZI|nr:Spherulation-specific family 4 [Neurospora hispaniola]
MSTILIPLYIYPSFSSSHESSGWAPLFRALTTALTKNPSLEFLVVINPGNGPGPDYPIPNADYRAALSKLSDTTQYPNVKVIGWSGPSRSRCDNWHCQPHHMTSPASSSGGSPTLHRIALPITSNHPPVNTGLWQHCTITSESPIQQPGKDISYDARRAADHGYQWLLKIAGAWTPPCPHLRVVRTFGLSAPCPRPAGVRDTHLSLELSSLAAPGTTLVLVRSAVWTLLGLISVFDSVEHLRRQQPAADPLAENNQFSGPRKSLASTQFPNGASSTGMSKDPELSTEAQLELLLELAERPHSIFASGRRKIETSAAIALFRGKRALEPCSTFLETLAHWCFSRISGLVWRSPHAHGPQGWRSMSERKATEISDFPNLLFPSVFLASPLRSNPARFQPGSVPARARPHGDLGGEDLNLPLFFFKGSLSLFAGKQTGIRSLKDPVLAIDTRRRAVHGPLLRFVPLPALCISRTKAIRLDGIFVDEVPIDAQYLDYLQRITDSVRSGFAEVASRRSHCDNINSSDNTSLSAPSSSTTSSTTGLGIVIHNPGIFPSADSSDAFFSPRLVDYVVVFENCLAAWWDSGDYVNANLALLTPEKRAKAIAVAHTCGCGPKSQAGGSSGGRPQQPDSGGHHAADAEKTEGSEKEAIKKNVQNFLDEVVTQHKLAGHFATSATDYATWCSGWEGYVEVACDLGGSNTLTGEASEEGLHG